MGNGANKERRCHKRVFYSAEDHMTGVFVFPGDHQKVLEANILNISVGGLHFTVERNKLIPLKIGDQLILKKIVGNAPFRIVYDFEIEIKWVLDYQRLKHVGFGCEFRNLPDGIYSQVSNFIESGLGDENIPVL